MKVYRPMLLMLVVLGIGAGTASAGEWRLCETRHYRIWTDVDDDLAQDLVTRMDAMYAEYARRFAAFTTDRPQEKHAVYVFAKRDDYIKHTRDIAPNTGGIFIPGKKLLAAFLEGQGRDGLRRTLQHEAFHQFAHEAIGPNMPVWLNEGIAQIFEEAIWTGDHFIVGQVPPRRVRQLQQDMQDRRLIEFKRILSMSDRDWSAGMLDRATGSMQYNQAWAMAHFLIYATDVRGNPQHRARVIQMLRLIRDGVKPQDAFVQSFSDNITGFQQRFVEYARELRPTLEATYIENQTILADMLTMLRAEGVTFKDIKQFREQVQRGRYRLSYTRGPLRWTTADDPGIYFLDTRGRQMNSGELFFQYRQGAPLPDLICRAIDGIQFHTRFFENGEKLEYEVLIARR